MSVSMLASQLLVGLSRGMIYFIVAAGLTLVFGVLRVINFTHGSFYMLGAFIGYSVAAGIGHGSAGFWLMLVLAPLAVAGISLLVERGFLQFVYRREHLIQVLLTYALVLIAGDLVKFFWGSQYRSLSTPPIFTGSFATGSITVPKYNVFLLLVGPLVALGLWLFLSHTRFGKICRATATDREMVDILGVNSTWIFAAVFALGGWLAGLGGALMAPVVNISLGMDANTIIYAFLIVVVGGLGNIWGALISSLIIGVGEAFGALFMPDWAVVLPYIITGVLLILRPSGLLKSVW